MGRLIGSKNKQHKQFCVNGHDISVVGRFSSNSGCKQCRKEKSINERIDPTKDSRIIQFCPRGHDTFVVGRASDGTCIICSREKHKQGIKETNWKKQGILNPDGSPFTIIDYDRAYQIQGGRCAICKKHQTEFKRRLSADHDHVTGIFRGILCDSCNKNVGILENKVWCSTANKYLNTSSVRI
jgi:recombination endonuclease VII